MLGLVISGFLIVQFSHELPSTESIKGIELKVPLRVYSSDNLLISEFGNERRNPIAYENIPQILIDAVLASEDDGFFEHSGVDFKGLIRAALSNAQTGRSGQGASTITMQVARNFFLSRDKTYTRKLKEVLLSFRLEQILSKEEILSLYLNKIFLGHRAYGFGAAADVYYASDLSQLSIAQTAMLAGLPKAPSTFNPLRNKERALIRRNYVLGRLLELNKITKPHYDTAILEPITAQKHGRKADLDAPHIAEMVRAKLIEDYGEDAYWQGLNVYTTIASKQQAAAQASLRKGLQAYDRRHGFRGHIGKIDLDSIGEQVLNEPESLTIAYKNALAIYPSSQEHIPAIVLSVSKNESVLWTRDFGDVQIELSTSKWARQHKTPNLVGDSPSSMIDLMTRGDVLYIQQQKVKTDISATPNLNTANTPLNEPVIKWVLSQIPNVGGALISMEPSTGRILSLVGGYDFFLNKYNRATQSIRQSGSNIKPFIYSASLDKGFTPASLINGSSIVIRDRAHGTLWRPENYSGKFFGPTRIREALGKSMNLVSIRLLRSIGIPYAREYVKRFGIDMSRFSSSLTMALGTGGVKPIEMLRAYSVLANGGYKVEPFFIDRITDRHGNNLFIAPQAQLCDECYAEHLPKPDNVIDPALGEQEQEQEQDSTEQEIAEQTLTSESNSTEAGNTTLPPEPNLFSTYLAPRVMSHANNFLTVSMMKDVIQRGTARRALALNRQDLAGKTGTTNDYIDAWFTGFNSKVATTVWVGFDSPGTMGRGEAGSLTALPIWVDYMKTGLEGVPEDKLDLPDYIETGLINRRTGKPTDELDPNAIKEFFVVDTLTPEAALLKRLYGSSEGDHSDGELAAIPTNELNNQEFEDESNGSDILEEMPDEINPQERILADPEDTEGLF